MPFRIIRNDITKTKADAIVNTANPEPVYGNGTDRAVYEAAGAKALLARRKKIGRIAVGQAVHTPAFALSARYIIHTVGPLWEGGTNGEYEKLASCYRESLLLAKKLKCKSIAFPLISTGVYDFPKDQALSVALKTISEFLEQFEMDVTLVVFDRHSFHLSESLTDQVDEFINENYVGQVGEREYGALDNSEIPDYYGEDNLPFSFGMSLAASEAELTAEDAAYAAEEVAGAKWDAADADRDIAETEWNARLEAERRRRKSQAAPQAAKASAPPPGALPGAGGKPAKPHSLDDLINKAGESFQECLLRLIDERGMSDVDVYKKANLDRKLFSKIRCNPNYHPKKATALSLAVALGLNMDETIDLLSRAEFALSPSSKADLIVTYCIEHGIYDIFEINAILFKYDQPLLGQL